MRAKTTKQFVPPIDKKPITPTRAKQDTSALKNIGIIDLTLEESSDEDQELESEVASRNVSGATATSNPNRRRGQGQRPSRSVTASSTRSPRRTRAIRTPSVARRREPNPQKDPENVRRTSEAPTRGSAQEYVDLSSENAPELQDPELIDEQGMSFEEFQNMLNGGPNHEPGNENPLGSLPSFEEVIHATLAANRGQFFGPQTEDDEAASDDALLDDSHAELLELRVSEIPTPPLSISAGRKRIREEAEIDDDDLVDPAYFSTSDQNDDSDSGGTGPLTSMAEESCIRCRQRGTKCLFTVVGSSASGSLSTAFQRTACVECSQRHTRCQWAAQVETVHDRPPTTNPGGAGMEQQTKLARACRSLKELVRKEQQQAEEIQERINSWNVLLECLNAEA